jgi:hypothetical protein
MHERRLAIFLRSLADGGAERMMLHLARGVLAEGISCGLVLANTAGPLRFLVPPGTRVVQLGVRRVLGALPTLVPYLRRQHPEALLGSMDHASIVALRARALALGAYARLRGSPKLASAQGMQASQSDCCPTWP